MYIRFSSLNEGNRHYILSCVGARYSDSYVIYLFKNIYLFIYLFMLHQVLVEAHDIFVVACGIFSCGIWDLSVVACGLLSCGMWTFSCSMHVRSSFSTRDWTQAPCMGAQSLTYWTTRDVPICLLISSSVGLSWCSHIFALVRTLLSPWDPFPCFKTWKLSQNIKLEQL